MLLRNYYYCHFGDNVSGAVYICIYMGWRCVCGFCWPSS